MSYIFADPLLKKDLSLLIEDLSAKVRISRNLYNKRMKISVFKSILIINYSFVIFVSNNEFIMIFRIRVC